MEADVEGAEMTGVRWTPEQLAAHQQRVGIPPIVLPKRKAHSVKVDGYRSKAEARYAAILEARKASGEIRDWAYESIRLRLVDGEMVTYTPDFMVHEVDGALTFIEIKGFLREAARIRFLMAREKYPMFQWRFIWAKRKEFVEQQW